MQNSIGKKEIKMNAENAEKLLEVYAMIFEIKNCPCFWNEATKIKAVKVMSRWTPGYEIDPKFFWCGYGGKLLKLLEGCRNQDPEIISWAEGQLFKKRKK